MIAQPRHAASSDPPAVTSRFIGRQAVALWFRRLLHDLADSCGALLLLHRHVAAFLCPGEVTNSSVPVSHRFTCKQPSLECVALLNTPHPLSFYAARELCQRINGTVLELRSSAAARCFEDAKEKAAPHAPFWINVVEVDTPRCQGICPNFIDLRWASDLPPDVCLLRSEFQRSCSRHSSRFSCSQKGCCHVITDENSSACLLPTSPAAGRLSFHNFFARDSLAVFSGRRCAFIDASECPMRASRNIWHLKLCVDSSAPADSCQPSQNIRAACLFPKRPTPQAEVLLRSKVKVEEKKDCARNGNVFFDDAVFWIAVGAIFAASFIILFLVICWCKLRNQEVLPRRPNATEVLPSLGVH